MTFKNYNSSLSLIQAEGFDCEIRICCEYLNDVYYHSDYKQKWLKDYDYRGPTKAITGFIRGLGYKIT